MNKPISGQPHQLSRKNNDAHSRKPQNYIYYQNFVPITSKTASKPCNPPNRKRSVSTLKNNLLVTSHDTPNQPFKKLKPISPSSHTHLHQQQLDSTRLKAVKTNPLPPPTNQKTVLLNVTNLNSLKPVEKKNEKSSKVPWTLHLPELRPGPAVVETRPTHPSPIPKTVPIAKPVRVKGSPKPSKPIHGFQISTPLKKVRVPKAVDTRQTFDLSPAGLEQIRPSKPLVPTRPMCPIISSHSFAPISLPKSPSPMVSPSKKRNRVTGELLARARRLIETDQSSLRMWQSDLDAGAVRGGTSRKFKVLQVHKDRGSQIAYCREIEQSTTHPANVNPPAAEDNPNHPMISKIFLRGPDCRVNERLKIFSPWSEIQPNIIISNKFISTKTDT